MTDRLDFIIAGVQKSATTWLYNCIVNHPEVCLRNNKQEKNYYGGKVFNEKGEEWFWSQFTLDNKENIVGDVSVEYIVDLSSVSELKRRFPELKLILCLRNPVERAISAYYWYKRKSLIPDVPLDQFFSREQIANPDSKLEDILERGLYAQQITRLLEVVPASDIQIIFYDDISQKPEEVLFSIWDFLKLENRSFVPPNLNERPKKTSNNKFLISVQRQFPNSKVVFKLAELFTNLFENKNSEYQDEHVFNNLIDYYHTDIISLEKLAKNQLGITKSKKLPFKDWISR